MRKLSVGLSVALAIVAAATLGAQTKQAPADEGQVTVTGCLERAPASTDAQIGSNGTTPGPLYVLVMHAADTAGTTGSVGTSGSTDRKAKTTYRLQTDDVANLVGLEGARVRVTGTADDRKGDGKSKTASSAPTLKILSIKTVSSSCGG